MLAGHCHRCKMSKDVFNGIAAGLKDAVAYAKGDAPALVQEPGEEPVLRYVDGKHANTAENLRQLLRELYVSGALRDDLPESECARALDCLLDATEGRPFKPLGLPFPKV